jgi:hypothetical protein
MARTNPTGRTLAATGAAALTLITACAAAHGQGAGSGSSHAAMHGTVTGRFVMEGGPLGPGGQQPKARPIPGLVQFMAGRRMIKVPVGRSGTFSVSLPPGTYRVAGRSPRITQVAGTAPAGPGRERPCTLPRSVTVTPHSSTAITLACVVP